MKAVVYEKYGTPDVLELRDVTKPIPKDNEVLVKIYCTTVTAGDWRMRKADPAKKPSNMSFEEAAAVPIGGTTALRFLKHAGVTKGQNVLIYGASGSVGTFAVQLAAYFGANVTAVCSTANLNLVKTLGAGQVIDYAREDFTKIGTRFDVIFDAVGKTTKSACKNLLKPGGKFLSVMTSRVKSSFDLLALKEIIESGKLKSVIDRKYTLGQIREAHAYVEKFHKKGNVIIQVVENP